MVWLLYMELLSYGLQTSGLYRHRIGLGLHRVGYNGRRSWISASPRLPSTPRKVPSGHGTKSSILYLHSPRVRPKMIVRLSGHRLVRDSLSSPWTRLQWWWVRREYCLRHCKAGSSSEYFIEDFEHKDSVWLCKISSTYHRRENNISTNIICWHVLTAWHHTMARLLFKPLFSTSSTHIARRFSWHVLSKQRSCSPYHKILINTDVGNPTVPSITAPGE